MPCRETAGALSCQRARAAVMAESVYGWTLQRDATSDSAPRRLAPSHCSHYWQLTTAWAGVPHAPAGQGELTGQFWPVSMINNPPKKERETIKEKNNGVNKSMWLHSSGLGNSTWTVDVDILSLQWFIAFYITLCFSFFFSGRRVSDTTVVGERPHINQPANHVVVCIYNQP